jgi:hypothetical protein
MSLYEKIYSIMNESMGLEKDLLVGKGDSAYRAVGEKEVLNMLKPLFKKYKLIVFPICGDISEQNSIFDTSYDGKVTTKSRNVTQIKVNFKIVDIESGESEMLVGFGNGADSQDKGSGKAFTYAFKTMLSKTFMLFSGEDTDNEHSDDIGRAQQSKPATTVNNAPSHTSVTSTSQTGTQHVLGFGKYKGKTFDEIALTDEKYIHWLAENSTTTSIKKEASEWIKWPPENSKIDICTGCGKPITSCECGLPF